MKNEFPVNTASKKSSNLVTEYMINPLLTLMITGVIWFISLPCFHARNYSGESSSKAPRKLNRGMWNMVREFFYFEWDYHMVHGEEFLGGLGLCLINPWKTPFLPSGILFIVYGNNIVED